MHGKPIIIALAGRAGAGKDTVADFLVTHAGFTKLAFAQALRDEVAGAYHLGGDFGLLSDRATKEQPTPRLALGCCGNLKFVDAVAAVQDEPVTIKSFMSRPRSPRQILQWWGTEYRRAEQPNYWSTKVALEIAALQAEGRDRFVVADCRFPNEANAMRAMGGEVWRVWRADLMPLRVHHSSETDGRDLQPAVMVPNDSSIIALGYETLDMLQHRFGGVVVLSAGLLPPEDSPATLSEGN